ncbi:VOC family protein [Boseongicola aestuarii]|uniref:Glyoxalase-like domain protein n=1 Tax=Boseongicola aestuarii TaxID=1470561 RepID=A0A238J1Y1_9RHOB|nr:VOC family protein [Boseongicola aestuarii]SMX24222.1 Glyoxalase-like domain protein [Boseongicola aestuarii]
MTAPTAPSLAITFLYYRDLKTAEAFYAETLGLPLVIDQGWAKIFRLAEGAHIGLVDESRGMNNWQAEKCVQLCLRVEDVDAWYAWARAEALADLSEMFQNDEIGIRAFVFSDPEGYQIEVQTPTRQGA